MAKLIKFTVTSLHPCVILPPIRVLRDMNCIFKKVLGWQPINPSVTATVRTLLFFNLSEKVVCSWRSTRCQTARLLRTKTFVLPSLGTHAALVAAHSNKNPVSSPFPIWTNETSAHVRLTERCTNGFLYVHFRHFKSPLTLFALKIRVFHHLVPRTNWRCFTLTFAFSQSFSLLVHSLLTGSDWTHSHLFFHQLQMVEIHHKRLQTMPSSARQILWEHSVTLSHSSFQLISLNSFHPLICSTLPSTDSDSNLIIFSGTFRFFPWFLRNKVEIIKNHWSGPDPNWDHTERLVSLQTNVIYDEMTRWVKVPP